MTEIYKDLCYACYTTEKELYRPCNNSLCNARICGDCIIKQTQNPGITSNNCGICRNPIVITRTNVFDAGSCFGWYLKLIYLKLIYLMVMMIGGPIGLVFLALGKIPSPWIECMKNGKDVSPCDGGGIGLIFFTLFTFIPVYFQLPLCYLGPTQATDNKKWFCCKYNIFRCLTAAKETKNKSYITMGIMLILLYLF